MKGKWILIALVLVIFCGVSVWGVNGKMENQKAVECVKSFLETSYNTKGRDLEEVLRDQYEFYADTTKEFHERAYEQDLQYLRSLDQTLQLISDIDMEVRKNELGDTVVEAKFLVQVKDQNYPDGLTQETTLHFTLIRDEECSYKIISIW